MSGAPKSALGTLAHTSPLRGSPQAVVLVPLWGSTLTPVPSGSLLSPPTSDSSSSFLSPLDPRDLLSMGGLPLSPTADVSPRGPPSLSLPWSRWVLLTVSASLCFLPHLYVSGPFFTRCSLCLCLSHFPTFYLTVFSLLSPVSPPPMSLFLGLSKYFLHPFVNVSTPFSHPCSPYSPFLSLPLSPHLCPGISPSPLFHGGHI